MDAGTGDAIAGAHVALDGTTYAGRTDLTGRYTITGVPPGRYTLTVRLIGYAAKAVTDVIVEAEAAVSLDVTMTGAAVQIGAVEVTAEIERGSVVQALQSQRTASQIVSSVTAEQIKKSPDSDASQAVQRVSGVTVQDGKYVFVRGLGERYTTTSLNNTRIPSPEPERRVVPLDLFPSGLLQSITTSKTFTPEQPGDFTGAQVDLRTREFPTSRLLAFSLSTALNDAVLGQTLPAAPTVGREWLGFAGSARALPGLAGAAGDLQGLSQSDVNTIIGSFRDAWSAKAANGSANGSGAVSVGGEDLIANVPVGYLGSLTYGTSQEVHRDEERALAIDGGVPDSTLPKNRYRGSTATAGVLWGGLLNLSARPGDGSKISFNNTYTRSGDNSATRLAGFNEEFAQDFDITRLTYTERMVRSTQLAGEHLLMGRQGLTWSVTSSAVRRYEPDRSDLVYQAIIDTVTGQVTPRAWWGAPRSATRTFSDLHEESFDAAGTLALHFGDVSRPMTAKVGGEYRQVTRVADTRAFDISNIGLSDSARAQRAEDIFTPANAQAGALTLFADANAGRYDAKDHISAGFVQLEFPLAPRVKLIGGARVEVWHLGLTTLRTGGQVVPVARDNTDILPALALNFALSDRQTLRLSATQTLSRPEYRELSPVAYRDILGGLTVRGNAGLVRSLVQNVDARWEWYPRSGELVSIALFAKRFTRPIEKVLVATTGANELGFVNALAAHNYGVELEVRQRLDAFVPAFSPFTVFANATVMNSRIRPGNDSISSLTSSERPMVGQAPYVVNAGLNYAHGNGLSATLLYNVVGRRIIEAGTTPLPDTYEEARNLLDLSVQLSLTGSLSLRTDVRNLLDAPYHLTQGSVTRWRYSVGRSLSAGVSWQR